MENNNKETNRNKFQFMSCHTYAKYCLNVFIGLKYLRHYGDQLQIQKKFLKIKNILCILKDGSLD